MGLRGSQTEVPKVPEVEKKTPNDRMGNKEFAEKLEERTRRFGVRIIRLSSKLPNTSEGRVIRTQITKCGTSVGANYREANRSRRKADFKNRIRICERRDRVLAGNHWREQDAVVEADKGRL